MAVRQNQSCEFSKGRRTIHLLLGEKAGMREVVAESVAADVNRLIILRAILDGADSHPLLHKTKADSSRRNQKQRDLRQDCRMVRMILPRPDSVNPVHPVWFSSVTPHSEFRIGNWSRRLVAAKLCEDGNQKKADLSRRSTA
jgi:hypothetical protein